MLRIREKQGQFFMTLKIRKKRSDVGIQSFEHEILISPEQAQKLLERKLIFLSDSGLDKIFVEQGFPSYPEAVSLLGEMETYRTKLYLCENTFILELDHNTYLNLVDYELRRKVNTNVQKVLTAGSQTFIK